MKRILIVEHLEHLQTLLDYAITPFEDVDVDWSFASTGDEALQQTNEFFPHVVIVDSDLPHQAAQKLCLALKKRDSDLKIILLVPLSLPPEAMACEADERMTKPFEPVQLQMLLGKLLGISVKL